MHKIPGGTDHGLGQETTKLDYEGDLDLNSGF